MDYYQGVVTEYLRAKRSVFLNPECMITLDQDGALLKGRHWYCDVIAADFDAKALYLCEITYSATMQALLRRLVAWRSCWSDLSDAVKRDSQVSSDWLVYPWIFMPEKHAKTFVPKYQALLKESKSISTMPPVRITHLESIVPWEYVVTWNRKDDHVACVA